MKSIILAVLVCIAFSSCKKDWVCHCTWDNQHTSFGLSKTTKKNARVQCDSINRDFVRNNLGTCTLYPSTNFK